MPHRPAQSLSGARGLAAIAFVFTVTMLGTTLPAPLYPIYEQQFGYSALIIAIFHVDPDNGKLSLSTRQDSPVPVDFAFGATPG